MAATGRRVGWFAFGAIFFIFVLAGATENPPDLVSRWLFHRYAMIFNDPSPPIDGLIVARWYLAAVALNAVSILSAGFLIYFKSGIRRSDLLVFGALTLAFFITLWTLIYVQRPIIDFTVIVFLTNLIYVCSDVYGMLKVAPKLQDGHEFYWFPFWCLDLPTLLVLGIFIVARHIFDTISLEFYEGVGIGAMALGAFCYVVLLTNVLGSARRFI